MDARIREQRLPGIGHRYEVPVGDDRSLIVVVQLAGGTEICISGRRVDEPATSVGLSHDQAVVVAALLTGARFRIEPAPKTATRRRGLRRGNGDPE